MKNLFRLAGAGFALWLLNSACNVNINPGERFFTEPPAKAWYKGSGRTHLVLESNKNCYSFNLNTSKAGLFLKGHPDAYNWVRETIDDLAILFVENPDINDIDIEVYNLKNLAKIFDTDTKNLKEGFHGIVKGNSFLFESKNNDENTLKMYTPATKTLETLLSKHDRIDVLKEDQWRLNPLSEFLVFAKNDGANADLYLFDVNQGMLSYFIDLSTIPEIESLSNHSTKDMLYVHAFNTGENKQELKLYKTSNGQTYQYPTNPDYTYEVVSASEDKWQALILEKDASENYELWHYDFQTSARQKVNFNDMNLGGLKHFENGEKMLIECDMTTNPSFYAFLFDPATGQTIDRLKEIFPEPTWIIDDVWFGARCNRKELIEVNVWDGSNGYTKLLYFNGQDIADPFSAYDHTWEDAGSREGNILIAAMQGTNLEYLLFNMEQGTITPTTINPDYNISSSIFLGNLLHYIAWDSSSNISTFHVYDINTGIDQAGISYEGEMYIEDFTKETIPRLVIDKYNGNANGIYLLDLKNINKDTFITGLE